MHATDLDVDIDCPACGGTGDALPDDRRDACPVCGGSAVYNRYEDPPTTKFISAGCTTIRMAR